VSSKLLVRSKKPLSKVFIFLFLKYFRRVSKEQALIAGSPNKQNLGLLKAYLLFSTFLKRNYSNSNKKKLFLLLFHQYLLVFSSSLNRRSISSSSHKSIVGSSKYRNVGVKVERSQIQKFVNQSLKKSVKRSSKITNRLRISYKNLVPIWRKSNSLERRLVGASILLNSLKSDFNQFANSKVRGPIVHAKKSQCADLNQKYKLNTFQCEAMPFLINRTLCNKLFYCSLGNYNLISKTTKRSRQARWLDIFELKCNLQKLSKASVKQTNLRKPRRLIHFSSMNSNGGLKYIDNLLHSRYLNSKYGVRFIKEITQLLAKDRYKSKNNLLERIFANQQKKVKYIKRFSRIPKRGSPFRSRLSHRNKKLISLSYRKTPSIKNSSFFYSAMNSSGFLINRLPNFTQEVQKLALFFNKNNAKSKFLLNSLYQLRVYTNKRNAIFYQKSSSLLARDEFSQPSIVVAQRSRNSFRRLLPTITITFREKNLFFVLSNPKGDAVIILSSGQFIKKNKLKRSSVPAFDNLASEFAKKVSRLTSICGIKIHGFSRRKFPILKTLRRSGIKFAFVVEHHAIVCNGVRKSRKARK
jgi:ribosomal protein S11